MKKITISCSLFFMFLLNTAALAQSTHEDGSRVWIARPWELRYVLIVDAPSNFLGWSESGQEEMRSDELNISSPHAIFPDIRTIQIRRAIDFYEGGVGLLLIEFSQQGDVITPHSGPPGLKGHINRLGSLVLAAGNAASDRQFHVNYLHSPRSSEQLQYTPALCSDFDLQVRYIKGYKSDSVSDGFGCQEWDYYLKSAHQPYIDVTTYENKTTQIVELDPVSGKYLRRFKTNAHIYSFIGWGRFDIAAKPVIGNFENTWVCLHECPDGEAPGVIPDIKEWVKKRGWPLPKRPKKQPMFPDVERKPGDFVD